MKSREATLAGIPLFSALDDGALAWLAGRLEEVVVPSGAAVFDEGDASLAIFIVLSGAVELRRSGVAGPVVVGTRGPGSWFGEVGLIGIKRRGVVALAVERAVLLVLPARALHELYERDLHAYALVTMNLARELARKLEFVEQSFVDATERGESGGTPQSP